MHGGTERSLFLTPLKEAFIFITNINQQSGSAGVRGLGGGWGSNAFGRRSNFRIFV